MYRWIGIVGRGGQMRFALDFELLFLAADTRAICSRKARVLSKSRALPHDRATEPAVGLIQYPRVSQGFIQTQ
jgi:hypothetical protein